MKFEDLCKKIPEVSIGESRFFYDEGVYISSQQKTSDNQKQTEEISRITSVAKKRS